MSKLLIVPKEIISESVATAHRAAAMAEKVAGEMAKVAAKAPVIVDAMIGDGILDQSHKQATIDKLCDHVAALDVLARVMSLHKQSRLGKAIKPDAARQSRRESEADRVFAENFHGA